MKKQFRFLLLLTLLVISGICAHAQLFTELTRQDTTLVYKLPNYAKDPLRSGLRKQVVKKDSLWLVILSDAQKKKVEEISYADEKLEVRTGPYRLYQKGILIQAGNYDRGYKHGRWFTFYPSGKPEISCNYRWDKLWGPYQKYSEDGSILESYNYLNDKLVND